MKVISTIAFLIVANLLFSQSCNPAGGKIWNQVQIDDFNEFWPGCTEISGDLCIGNCGPGSSTNTITDLDGLAQLTRINGILTIKNTNSLEDLSGLHNLTYIGGLVILNNQDLKHVDNLENLIEIAGSVTITNNFKIETINNFSNLETVESISIGNTKITSFPDLGSVNKIGNLALYQNHMLSSVSQLTDIDSCESLSLYQLTSLSNLYGLENKTISGSLRIDGVPVQNANQFTGIDTIHGSLTISGTQLSNLNSFASLTAIDGFLDITGNSQLTSISGLENIDAATINHPNNSVDLLVRNNSNLSNCVIESFCDAINDQSKLVQFYGNAGDCNSPSTIQCGLLTPPSCANYVHPMPGDTSVSINTEIIWNKVDFATGYFIDIGTSSNTSDILNNYVILNDTTFSPSSFFPQGTEIFVQIRAFNMSGSASGCQEISFVTEIIPIPQCTEMNVPLNGATMVPATTAIRWKKAIGADGYRLSLYDNTQNLDIIQNLDVGSDTFYFHNEYYTFGSEILVNIIPYNVSGNAISCPQYTFTTFPPVTCGDGNTLTLNQAEISTFPETYPGCIDYEGQIRISGNDVIDLKGLQQLKSIRGGLEVFAAHNLKSTYGLHNIENITGDLQLKQLLSLDSIYLNQLKSVSGSLDFNDTKEIDFMNVDSLNEVTNLTLWSTNLDDLSDFANVDSIRGIEIRFNNSLVAVELNTHNIKDIIISENPILDTILIESQFDTCSLSIFSNDNLKYIEGLNFNKVSEAVLIHNNTKLESINIFDNLSHIGPRNSTFSNTTLWIANNSSLSSMEEWGTTTTDQIICDGDVIIKDNTVLNNICFLNKLSRIEEGGITIDNNSFQNLNCLEFLTNVESLSILNEEELVSLSGLQSLTCTEHIELINNQALVSIDSIANISFQCLNELNIANNQMLSECAIEPICEYLTFGTVHNISNNLGDCTSASAILNNCSISSCLGQGLTLRTQSEVDGFLPLYNYCIEIVGDLTIESSNNDPIYNLNSLSNITSVLGSLTIKNTSNLQNISGLQNIKNIEEGLFVTSNNALESLMFNDELTVANNILIENNPSLTTIDGFQVPFELTGDLKLINLPELIDLDCFNSITSLRDLFVDNLALVTSLPFNNLDVVRDLVILKNDLIVDFDGLNSLDELDRVIFSENNNLESIGGLQNISSIDQLEIKNNDKLEELDILTTLDTVRNLVINLNDALQMLPLESEFVISNILILENNPNLEICNINPICDIIFNGHVVRNNDIGCNSLEEIFSLCFDMHPNDLVTTSRVLPLTDYSNYEEDLFLYKFANDEFFPTTPTCAPNEPEERDIFAMAINDTGQTTDISFLFLDVHPTNLKGQLVDTDLNQITCSPIFDNVAMIASNVPAGDTIIARLFSTDNSVGTFKIAAYHNISVLPVELLSFEAVQEEGSVLLKWSTASEFNNEGYEIQCRTEGAEWRTLDLVKGKGTTTSISTYSYEHRNPSIGKNYYRILQRDFDGVISFSDVKTVDFIGSEVLSIYPNPAVDILYLSANSEYKIYSMYGTLVKAGNSSHIDVSEMSNGFYILSTRAMSYRFVKL